jgi:CubicO group peptidase (beta-lactamase class C family)
MDFSEVDAAFQEAVNTGVFPGAVAIAALHGRIIFERAFGSRSLVPQRTPLDRETIYDLASLTKPLATTLAVMLLIRDGLICADDTVTRFLPSFGEHGKQRTTVRHLLNHSSGLPAWKPFYQEIIQQEEAGRSHLVGSRAAKRYLMKLIHKEKPLTQPGERCVYSDLGFIVLGELVETVTATTLDRFCSERIYRPLGVRSMGFIDLTSTGTPRAETASIAPTERCPWRNKILCGEVHDDNAYAMGGVAGHAGLFASALDVHEVLASLGRCRRGEDDFWSSAILSDFFTRDERAENARFALGWDTPSPGRSASGSFFSSRSIGHLGFTGTSIWWDLDKDCYIILLTNRVHPSRDNDKIRDFRPRIHDLIMKAVFP